MISLLLVDDHRLFRKSLGRLLDTFCIKHVLYEASNGLEAIALLSTNSIDIVLLDIRMPQMGGIEAIKKIREAGSQTKIIVLTQFDEESLIVYLLQLGVNGFLLKNCDPGELEKAIITVSVEGHFYNDLVLKVIEHNLSRESKLANLDISPREFQVMVLMKDGKLNKEIAINLGLTVSTVESYRKSLIKKTKCRNTAELISLAYRTGILPM